jgi:hypothetical protein
MFNMKRIILGGLLVAVMGGTAVGQRATNHTVRFNPSGEYHPLDRPADDVGLQFHLQVRYKGSRRVAWGGVASVVHWYQFRSVSVQEKQLRFSTQRHHGVWFAFDGSFLRGGNFTTAADVPGSFPLRGTLRKFVNGKKVMELNTSFLYYVGC